MRGLTINFHALKLSNEVLHSNNKVRINVVTIPDNKKQSIIVNPKNIEHNNYFIRLNISDQIEKLLFVFEKKSFYQNDQIIASKAINSNKIPKSPIDSINIEVKSFRIYEPYRNEIDSINKNRKVIGRMSIQFLLSEPFEPKLNVNSYNICKIYKGEGYAKVNSSGINDNSSNSIFLDTAFIN